ncbi:MAG: Smr/MutS family protein [Zoogloeaceae bacterium]|jgi:DNA-nicking Smr family endonuclease|nr:Smr/MutS family protein [Zoogloeaceae bacterium]
MARRAQFPACDALREAFFARPETLPAAKTVEPDQAERALFAAAMEGVRPLPPSDRAEIAVPRPPPLPRQRCRDERQVLEESLAGTLSVEDRLDMDDDDSVFLRAGVSRRALVNLRRGRWVVQAELDLHGHDRETAREALSHFLAVALLRGNRCVRIIHGKGLSSPGGQPVLKILTRQWLAHRAEVLAFCQAKPRDGGEGALLALLGSRPDA